MFRRLSLLLAAALTTVGAAAAFAQEEEATGLGIRLVEVPEERANDPRARSYIIDHLPQGTTFTRKIEVSNATGRDGTISLYDGPASLSGGRFTVGGRGEASEITDWIEVSPGELVMPTGTRQQATVTVSIPKDAADGEYYGAIWAEIPGIAPAGSGVAVASRVGIRVYLSVGAGAEPGTDFELPAFRPVRLDDGRPAVEIDACNTGGRAIDIAGTLDLKDGPGGTSAGPFETEQPTTLAPEQCHTFTIPLDEKLPLGPWNATAKLSSGKNERTAEARITFPKDPGGRGKKVDTREVTGTLPGIIATGTSVFLLLLLTGGLLWFLLKRRKRKKDDEEERPSGSGSET